MNKFNINFDALCSLAGRVHVYWLDKENTLLGCNKLQFDTFKKFYTKDRQSIIGNTIPNIFGKNGENVANFVCLENEEVLRTEKPKQFDNIWLIPNFCKIKMLTIKSPFYDNNGKLAGTFGISHYVNEISVEKFKKFHLSKREAECLSFMLKGKTMREIAEILNISRKTVESYIENIKNKLDCNTRSELISKSFELGIEHDIW